MTIDSNAPTVEDKCTCVTEPQEPHSCPYASEITDNYDPTYCNCCSYCEHQCCMDI
jgi:hypothetical protein